MINLRQSRRRGILIEAANNKAIQRYFAPSTSGARRGSERNICTRKRIILILNALELHTTGFCRGWDENEKYQEIPEKSNSNINLKEGTKRRKSSGDKRAQEEQIRNAIIQIAENV